jgi:hypothetical protein
VTTHPNGEGRRRGGEGHAAVLPDALGFTGRFNLVSVAVAFVVGWLSATRLVGGYVLSLVLVGFGGERAPLRMDQGLRRGPRATGLQSRELEELVAALR